MADLPKKGQSLWKDAWRRLRKNKAAMFGLVVSVFMSLVAILADLLIGIQPDYGQPWLLAQPPGFKHPAVLAENRFDVGKDVVVPREIPDLLVDMLSEDGELTFTVHEFDESVFSVRVRRGKVQKIRREQGAVTMKKLEVAGKDQYLQFINERREAGEKLFDIVLKPRGPVPAALKDKGRVLILRLRKPRTPEPERIQVRIEGGKCTSILRDGKPQELLRIEGRDVLSVEKDGEARELKHAFGTDLQGRDVLARVIYGGRISLMVGAVATIVSVLIGVIYGALAGYLARKPMSRWTLFGTLSGMAFGAVAYWVTMNFPDPTHAWNPPWWTSLLIAFAAFAAWASVFPRSARFMPAALRETATTVGEFMMRIVDIAYALPFMFLVILLMISFGRNIFMLFIALGAVQWLTMARIVRGQVLSLKEKEFIEAAHMSGASHMSIVFRHLIPNTLGVVVVYSTLMIPAVILQESFLAFIGLTVEFNGRTLDSWGSLINQGRQSLTSTGGNWWALLFPSVAMAVTLFSLNFLGDGLRDALDPQQRGRT